MNAREARMKWQVALDMAGSYVASRRFEDAENVMRVHLGLEPTDPRKA